MSKVGNRVNPQEPIAVIGMSCIFPQAPDVKSFWQNILNGVNAIGDPLPEWEADWNLQAGRISTQKGGYLKDLYRFNPKEFGIMPASVDGGEPDQLLALQVAKWALQDAGEQYLDSGYDHTDTGIVLGHSTYFHRGQINGAQHEICVDQTMEILQAAFPMEPDQQANIRTLLKKQLPQFNADVCPGHVPNVMTGRIANRLNFSGPNYLIDAACASSLLSIEAAIGELRAGKSRMMLAGGVNASLPAQVLVIFTMLDALSKRGKVRPFDEDSDGVLLGEGLGIVVLKRLSDALADSDQVYAVVRGVGQSSDGKGFGLLTPSEKGETLAMSRTYESAGIDPESVSLVEAHGTGIVLGDKTEIAALKNIFGERQGELGTVAVGSVKSMISHCIPAAGAASFIKTCCALYHKVLPPMLCDKVNPGLGLENTPLYINNVVKPWISKPGKPRRAGINSFGFGGVNAHAILEEAPAEAIKPLRCAPWSAELFLFASENIKGLQSQLVRLESFLRHRDDCALSDIAFSLWEETKMASGPYRLALIAKDRDDLLQKVAQASRKLDKDDKPVMGKGGLVFTSQPVEGKLAFLFPGEGSQYLGMLSDLAVHFDEVRQWFDLWHGLYDEAPGSSRTDIVFPPNTELTPERRDYLKSRLHEMEIGSEAVFIAGQAMHGLLTSLGVQPDVMLGHSSGESSALVASRAVPWKDQVQLADFVRRLNKVYKELEAQGGIETGALMAIALLSKAEIEKHIEGSDILIAMENCPTQTIVYGNKEAVRDLSEILVTKGAICEVLPFDRGYHTPAFSPMKKVFDQYYKEIDLGFPQVPLYSCASAAAFPDDKESIRELASAQWVQTVRFIDAVNALYADGVRYFVEVGPGGKLTSFADQILRESGKAKECVVAASNVEAQEGLPQILNLMAKLYVNGKAGADGLFAGRQVGRLDFGRLEKAKPFGMYIDNTVPRLRATPELTAALQALVPASQMAPVSPAADDLAAYRPFITGISELSAENFVGIVRLNVFEDEFLQHHILSGPVSEIDPGLTGLACVPLMVTLEIMAEACVTLAGRLDLSVIEDVNTFDWIALDNGEVNLEVRASENGGRYYAEVLNEGGKIMSAYFTFGPQPSTLRHGLAPLMDIMPNSWPEDWQVYREGMFHGPIFQAHPYYKWNEEGIDSHIADLSLEGFFRPGDTPQMVLNPALFDAHNQLTAFWALEQVGTDFNSFPSKIERIELYGRCPQVTDNFLLRARRSLTLTPETKENPLWDFECLDAQGDVVLRMGNMESVYFKVPNEFYQVRRDPLNGWIGYPYDGTSGKLNWHIRYFPDEFCAQSKGIFLRILAHCVLNHEEKIAWQAIRGSTPPEKTRWLFRRFAVKEAVRYWIYQQTGELLYPSDIGVEVDDTGGAHVYGWWTGEETYLVPPPAITLQDGEREAFVSVVEAASILAA